MSYVLLDQNEEEVLPGAEVIDHQGFSAYVMGYNHRSVFVSPDKGYPKLHAMGFAPDVFDLHVVNGA